MTKKKKRAPTTPQRSAKDSGKQEGPFFRPFESLAKRAAESRTKTTSAAESGTASAPQPKPAAPARRAPAPTPKQAEDPDELLTFERLMSGVTPLDEGVRRVPTFGESVASRIKQGPAAAAMANREHQLETDAIARLHALVDEGSRFEVVDDGRRIEGRRRGADGRMIRKMRHGDVPIDATLDLHGMHAEQARAAVEAFVRDRRTKGDRVLVIVHGRGRNSPGGQSVLRGELSAWISEGVAGNHVDAFLTAPPEHGGEGALCVLLAQPHDHHRGMP